MLQPSGYDLYVLYRCHKCQLEHSVSIYEVENVGRKICYCGALLKFEPLGSISVTPEFCEPIRKIVKKPKSTAQPKPKTEPKPKTITIDSDLVVSLKNLGYKVGEAKTLIQQAITMGCDVSDVEQSIEFILTKLPKS